MTEMLKLIGKVGLSFISRFAFVLVASTAVPLFLALPNRIRRLRFDTFLRMPSPPSAAFGLGLDHASHLLDVCLNAVHDFKQWLERVLFVPECRARRRHGAVMLFNYRACIDFGGFCEVTRRLLVVRYPE
ncbi:hypothetical protein A5700_17595 [Mycobacterium sp. E1214]|nr:hypothetical protein A5700_17595 [Mycobacterium sp. E1214]OBH30006.1 hypothetical protein A5693_18590 [Mycobacterium sp. E1319]